eukprot:s370_g16.t4
MKSTVVDSGRRFHPINLVLINSATCSRECDGKRDLECCNLCQRPHLIRCGGRSCQTCSQYLVKAPAVGRCLGFGTPDGVETVETAIASRRCGAVEKSVAPEWHQGRVLLECLLIG